MIIIKLYFTHEICSLLKIFIYAQDQVEDPGLWAGEEDNFNHSDTLSISRIKIWVWRMRLGKKGRFKKVTHFNHPQQRGRNGFDGDKEA